MLLAKAQYAEAEPLYRRALAIDEKAYGPDHPKVAMDMRNLAELLRTSRVTPRRSRCTAGRWRLTKKPMVPTTPPRSRPATTSRWTGQTGDARQALRLFQALLPDQERVLGRDHPDTLRTRHDIASWTGQTGDARQAMRLSAELLPDQERVLGRDHPAMLMTRSNIAGWTGETGERAAGLGLFQALLPDQERVLGRDHPATLSTRLDIAPGPARRATRGRRCGCSRRCCRTRSGFWAATTPPRS